ncbi:MAG: SCO1664 family protein, partial [Actinomycetales bacterium]|nr:SCO1664 family protein [Actinomycetales bacterium]
RQLEESSNGALLAEISGRQVIFKASALERELWDFPLGSLVLRERATYLLDQMLGWNLVPRTELVETSDGLASLQDWVQGEATLIDIFPSAEIPSTWREVVSGQNEAGLPVSLAHADSSELQKIAVLDAIVNNADRKAGHLLTDSTGQTFAIDHGVTFHAEPKLRTVLWGWQAQPIPEEMLAAVSDLPKDFSDTELVNLLAPDELDALNERIADLLSAKCFPQPSNDWPSLPWPLF